MKISPHLVVFPIVSVVGCFAGLLELHGQGSLTPPGPPAPSMNSLSQLAPRIPLESVAQPGGGYSITTPGSYFASGMLMPGAGGVVIMVSASDVVIDLNGFGVTTSKGPTTAVYANLSTPGTNLKIMNGSISGPSVTVVGGNGDLGNLEISDLRVASTDGVGRILGDSVAATNPSALRVSFSGLNQGLVFQNGGTITQCLGSNLAITQGSGLRAAIISHSSIQDSSIEGDGSAVISGASVSHCLIQGILTNGKNAIGIEAATASDCAISDLGQGGTVSTLIGMTGNVMRGCHVTGLRVPSTSGFIVGISGSVINDCSVNDLQAGGSVQGIATLFGSSLGLVSKCSVRNVVTHTSTPGGASLNCGISAPTVNDCDVDRIFTSGSSVAGIAGTNVRGCRVGELFGGDPNSAGIITGSSPLPGVPGLVEECTVAVGGWAGILAKQPALIRNCMVTGPIGVMVNSVGVTVDSCTIATPTAGVVVTINSTSNLVIRNHVSGTAQFPYFVGANVRLGPIVSGAGGVISNTNPWANFAD